MRILFVHQNIPGQYKYLAPALARQPGHEVVFLTKRQDVQIRGVRTVSYPAPRAAHSSTHHYVRLLENSVRYGQAVARACQSLAREGFRPDVVIAHPGWGEALFIKDVLPRSALLNYCEFYYHGRGADVGFGAEQETSLDTICRTRTRNAHLLLSLESCDRGVSPTYWQRDQHPSLFRRKIDVIYDGIDVTRVRPDPSASFQVPNGQILTRDDEVLTYVARNLEPHRGFPSFMRALPDILRRRPDVHVVIVGGDEVSYGSPPEAGVTWREAMLAEAGPLDPTRVHMLNRLPYGEYLKLLQISSVHLYLTVPFVLSWSCMEALATGCLVVGSRTPPVEEVIRDGENGVLVDFHDIADISAKVAEMLAHRTSFDDMRRRARETVLGAYDLALCLPRQIALVRSMV